MDINSIGNYMSSYYASYVHKADVASANADFKTTSQKASKAEETEDVRELSDEEKLENFKKKYGKS